MLFAMRWTRFHHKSFILYVYQRKKEKKSKSKKMPLQNLFIFLWKAIFFCCWNHGERIMCTGKFCLVSYLCERWKNVTTERDEGSAWKWTIVHTHSVELMKDEEKKTLHGITNINKYNTFHTGGPWKNSKLAHSFMVKVLKIAFKL